MIPSPLGEFANLEAGHPIDISPHTPPVLSPQENIKENDPPKETQRPGTFRELRQAVLLVTNGFLCEYRLFANINDRSGRTDLDIAMVHAVIGVGVNGTKEGIFGSVQNRGGIVVDVDVVVVSVIEHSVAIVEYPGTPAFAFEFAFAFAFTFAFAFEFSCGGSKYKTYLCFSSLQYKVWMGLSMTSP